MIKVRITESDLKNSSQHGYSPIIIAIERTLNINIVDIEFNDNRIEIYESDMDAFPSCSFKMSEEDAVKIAQLNSLWDATGVDNLNSLDWKSVRIKLKKVS